MIKSGLVVVAAAAALLLSKGAESFTHALPNYAASKLEAAALPTELLASQHPSAIENLGNSQQKFDTTIVIKAAGSTLEFTPPRISVKNGLRVRLRFVNEGTLPHNVVIPKFTKDVDDLAVEAYGAGDTHYVPLSDSTKLIAYSILASPGETVEVTFVVPPPGEYMYVCMFPGHANTMFGTLRSLR